MIRPMEGVRVLEVAAWTYVPVAGAILADLGAEVIKVEPPTGDPQRALQNMLNFETKGPNPFLEIPNRGKRSITLDLKTDAGREVLFLLAKRSDVFLTSYLPARRAELGIDVEDLRRVNPDMIYVRGSGWGSVGPMKDVGGYDLASAWAATGMAEHVMTDQGPLGMPAAFFDLQGGNTIAGAIAMALFKRERTKEAHVVDVSLMNVGMWTLAPGIVSAPYLGGAGMPRPDRRAPGNPITNWYETRDGRWIFLVLLQSDRFWPELCGILERPDLALDERFGTARARFENRRACVRELDEIFASRDLSEWERRLASLSGVWAPALRYGELYKHPQVEENGFLPKDTGHDGTEFALVSPAMHFGGQPTAPTRPAPELGQDTESLLLESGLEWSDIESFRARGGLG